MHLLFLRDILILFPLVDQSELEPAFVFRSLGLRRGLPFGLLSTEKFLNTHEISNELKYFLTKFFDGRLGQPIVINTIIRNGTSVARSSGLHPLKVP